MQQTLNNGFGLFTEGKIAQKRSVSLRKDKKYRAIKSNIKMTYVKGDIVWVQSTNRHRKRLKHPAIVWQDEFDGGSDFIGLMITHTEPKPGFDNILLDESHFEKGHEVGFDNSHFVDQLFQKFQRWGPFHKSGSLTNMGIQFIEENLTNTAISEFDIYIRK